MARRLVAGVLLCVGVTLVAFLLTQAVPGDPVTANLGQRASEDPAAVAAFRAANGLDKPLPEQYLTYVGNLLHGDFGVSQQTRNPVAQDLAEKVPATMELALAAIGVAVVLGVGFGIVAALYRDRWPDQVLRVLSLSGVSVPTFWLALIAYYWISFKLDLLPAGGRLSPGAPTPPQVTGFYTIDSLIAGDWATFGDAVSRLVLPALVLASFTVGVLLRFTRAAVLEVLGDEYVRAARAKGLSELTVVRRHVLRPALLSVVTVTGVAFAGLLSGTVLVEQIFGWRGLGAYAYTSALALDLPAIMGVSVVVAVIYILINLVVDLLYGVIDPRLRLS
ncbi:ABC transporter permease [Klenkia sp. PcliD-1-E]|uniref:ABC transporter permease n=1 Tax=Klenkia sp. PcliD-1-E TaxID=2954492 RepID=UPI0020970A3A|nr:ABC transporter permease [Klenkia sp. PcliD-1-E]MCO7220603.1 ABC transporter permease [Klenkia sp. PcliD-1-E]